MKWSPQQDQARRAVAKWMREPLTAQTLYLAGYAGTGKSTLAKDLVAGSSRRWLFAAYTGKAAHVLRQKGCDGAATIHSLIYRPAGEANAEQISELSVELVDPATSRTRRAVLAEQIIELRSRGGPRFVLWTEGPMASRDVAGIVVDEVSMVDERLGRDLESFGKKILVLGDPAQLPPVKGGGYFTARTPDIMLTEVHRHRLESGVLRLATHIREGRSLRSFAATGTDVEIVSSATTSRDERSLLALAADQVLVGLNKTRHELNQRYRTLKSRSGLPYHGDRVVCLRNERELGLFNGSQWLVLEAESDPHRMIATLGLRSEDDARVVATEAWLHYFLGRGDQVTAMGVKRRDHSEFDWGYALTVHKAQGSQWNSVLVVDESNALRSTEPHRWLYTAVTRAIKHVVVLT